MLVVEDLTRAKWRCLHFAAAEEAGAIKAELARRGLAVLEIDGGAIETKEHLLSATAEAMHFPDYFGRNWDALDECLRDMTWMPSAGYVLFFKNAEAFWQTSSHLAGTFTEIWMSAAEEWSRQEIPFHLIFVW